MPEPTHRKRGRPGHDAESVLATAAALFYERGYDGASINELARRLGVTKSAVYHHVDGKEDLLGQIVDRALDGLFSAVDDAAELPRAVDRLQRVVQTAVRVLADELPYVTVLLRVRGNTAVERAAVQRRRAFDKVIADWVREAVDDGDLRADVDPALAARLMFGMVNSLVEWYRPRGGDADDVADAVVKVVFDGARVR